MGRLQAEEIVRLADIDTALRWQLRSNHFPPVSSLWIPVAKQCIERVQEIDTWEDGSPMNQHQADKILSELVTNPVRGGTVTIRKVMDALHLWSFV